MLQNARSVLTFPQRKVSSCRNNNGNCASASAVMRLWVLSDSRVILRKDQPSSQNIPFREYSVSRRIETIFPIWILANNWSASLMCQNSKWSKHYDAQASERWHIPRGIQDWCSLRNDELDRGAHHKNTPCCVGGFRRSGRPGNFGDCTTSG